MLSPREFLLFRLWGPMSSWGSIAVGEQRQTWARPSRSAVLGIVTAALGIERANAAAHRPFETGLGLAVRVDRLGSALRDYHTAQSPSSEAKRRWRSRHDEIHGAKTLNTILSERSYHAGMSAVVALWRRENVTTDGLAPLSEIEAALQRPKFALYLGRKAAPFGLPPDPLLQPHESLAAALDAFDQRDEDRMTNAKAEQGYRRKPLFPMLEAIGRDGRAGPVSSLWLDPADMDVVSADAQVGRQTQRRDGIRDRRTWTFDDRQEIEIKLTRAP